MALALQSDQPLVTAEAVEISDDHSSHIDRESDLAVERGGAIWVGIHFPSLALDVCKFTEGLPAVVIDQCAGKQVVHAACEIAMNDGITPGMSLNAAYALCANAVVKLRNPQAEQRRLQFYSRQLLCFTPAISFGRWDADDAVKPSRAHKQKQASNLAVNADSLLLDVSASLRLFGGLSSLLEVVRGALRNELVAAFAMYQGPMISVAPCPGAALLCARNSIEKIIVDAEQLKSALGDIALCNVNIREKLMAQLARCGLHTLRDLWRLSRQDLGRRFGLELLQYLDDLVAVQGDPQYHIAPPLQFRQRMELPVDTHSSHLLLIAAERLLKEACGFLQMHAAATEQVSFDLWHVNRMYGSSSRTRLVVRCAEADRQPDHFLQQFEQQLSRTPLQGEVNAVSILINQVVPYASVTGDVFDRADHQPRRQQHEWGQLLDLIRARLGRESVFYLHHVAEHQPEKSSRKMALPTIAPQKKAAVAQWQMNENHVQCLPLRPLWLLPDPVSIRSTAIDVEGELERIETGWWQRRDMRRDYQIAHVKQGGYAWVYQDLDQAEATKKSANGLIDEWKMHGLYA